MKAFFAATNAAPFETPPRTLTSILTGYVAGAINAFDNFAKHPPSLPSLNNHLDAPKDVNGVPTTNGPAVMASNIVSPEHFNEQMNTFDS